MTRTPPHSPEAEQCFLGHLIFKPDIIPAFSERLKVDDLYSSKNRIVYQALINMGKAGDKIDLVTLAAKLHGVVAAAHISALTDGLPKGMGEGKDSRDEHNIDEYFKIILQKSWLRTVINRSARVIEAALDGETGPTKDALSDLGEEVEFGQKRETIAKKVRGYADVTSGSFGITSIFRELHFVTNSEKSAVRVALHRMVKDGFLARDGKKDGIYRKIEHECDEIDWKSAPTDPMDIYLPMDLHNLVNIYPGNVIVVAGKSNAGKTAWMFDAAKGNQDRYPVHYFTSEMGGTETRVRLTKHEGITDDEWKFKLYERSSNFSDVMRKDCINIIDYLEVGDEFYKVGSIIKDIWDKLGLGLAFIALQKNAGAELGRGGAFGTEKPRLYLSVDDGIIKIVKAKNWKGGQNPNGMVRRFKLVGGWKFLPDAEWHYPESEDGDGYRKRGERGKRLF